MEQTDPELYSKTYYQNAYGGSVLLEKEGYFSGNTSILREMASLVKLTSNDLVIDYGCGNGNLSFFLAATYGCSCVGIDYSRSAIDICNEKLGLLPARRDTITFVHANNDRLPSFHNVSAVYLADVVEHMYDPEIELVLGQVKKWGNNIKVVVHTDNNIHLKIIRPLMDLITIVCGFKTWRQVKEANALDRSLHINLTNPFKLRAFMEKNGFRQIMYKYPTINRKDLVRTQLGSLAKVPGMIEGVMIFLRVFTFLSPSFYALYEHI